MNDMIHDTRPLSRMFRQFFDSEKSSGVLLIVCTMISLALAHSSLGPSYVNAWKIKIGGLTVEHWVNDALMAIFFLYIGLELEREFYSGELSNLKNALLPIFAAAGGLALPALFHFSLNAGTPTQSGIGIPMATDIAFALGALALLGTRVPAALKTFVVAFAIIDDLSAVIMIAVFYTAKLNLAFLLAALVVWGLLCILNRFFRVMSLAPYLWGGVVMWFFMLKSGVHATVAGVMLAFAIPYSGTDENLGSPSHKLEHMLHKPIAFIILPIFALANTAIVFAADWMRELTTPNSLGIIFGLVLGKPIGVTLLSLVAVASGMSRLPPGLGWRHVCGAGLLGGIGFTMSIFISVLAFPGDAQLANASKISILIASLIAGGTGFLWLRLIPADDSSSHATSAPSSNRVS